MPRMTGNRYFAEAAHAYGVTHVFFVPTIMLPAMAEMEDMGIRRVVTRGEKAAAYTADLAPLWEERFMALASNAPAVVEVISDVDAMAQRAWRPSAT
jgi:thiamine pyrophosphate-dependent acetolactate synthase large subunit-like protein